jgi:hypothetical protein
MSELPVLDLESRGPDTREKMRWLFPNPNLPAGTPQVVSAKFYGLGVELALDLNDGPQLTIALQRLIDAKDAAVRQAIADAGAAGASGKGV